MYITMGDTVCVLNELCQVMSSAHERRMNVCFCRSTKILNNLISEAFHVFPAFGQLHFWVTLLSYQI